MGTCKYCGLKTRLFSSSHEECERKHEQGLNDCMESLNAYFRGKNAINIVKSDLSIAKTNNYLSDEEVEDCCRQAIKNYTDSISLPITKQHLQLIDVFLTNIGISRSVLNKNGEIVALGTRLYQGVLLSHFAEKAPMAKVEKRVQLVSRLIPLSVTQKEQVGLTVLDGATRVFLEDGIISDSEQREIDEFVQALSLPINNLPQQFAGSDINKIQQANILRQLQKGQSPPPLNVNLPIMLTASEYVVWTYPDVTMYQEKIEKEWVGRSSGMSVRVIKGVYYRTGGMKGHPVEHSKLEKQAIGTLVLTNKNFIFYSPTKSAKIPYKKLIGVTPYTDGLELQKDGANSKRQIFQGFDSWFAVNFLSFINI